MTTPLNNHTSVVLSSNKTITNHFLREHGIPTPKGISLIKPLFNIHNLMALVKDLKFPVVLKPQIWSGLGVNVICNIPHVKALYYECERLFNLYHELHIEEFYRDLNSYRVLILDGKIIDVIARESAHVIGNGRNTLEQLVNEENANRAKVSDFLKPMLFDEEANYCLQEQKVTPQSVPRMGQKIVINYTSNASRGGSIKSMPVSMCKKNKQLLLKVAKLLNLQFVGIDIECKSLDYPINETGGVILEANHNPSTRIHQEGVGGSSKMITAKVIRSLILRHPISYLYVFIRNSPFVFKILLASVVGFCVIGSIMSLLWMRLS